MTLLYCFCFNVQPRSVILCFCFIFDLQKCRLHFLFQAHTALAEAEQRLTAEGRQFHVVTQNVDGLHLKAGSTNVLELHGSLMKTRCLKCREVRENNDSPICPALAGRG